MGAGVGGRDQTALDHGVEQRLMVGRGVDRARDLDDPRVLCQVSARARAERVEDRVIVGVGGQHDDLGVGLGLPDPAGGLDAVESRHSQIHQHDVRPVARG